MYRILLPSLLSLFLGTTFHASSAHACSCAISTKKQDYLNSDYIFVGKSLRSKTVKAGDEFPKVEFVVEVAKAYKGKLPRYVAVRTEGSSAMCGIELAKNQTYIVYANKGTRKYIQTSLCTRTQSMKSESAAENLAWLERLPGSLSEPEEELPYPFE